jgi:nuclear pore complex protein Nup62
VRELSTQLMSKSLEQVANEWSSQLEEQSKLFTKQAAQVSEWDEQIRRNADKLFEVHSEAQKVQTAQRELEEDITMIESQQRELSQLLEEVEREVSAAVQEAPGSSLIDKDRERGYEMAVQVTSRLEELSGSLRDVVRRVNEVHSRASAGAEPSPIEQITQILNSHMSTLQWAD